MSGMLKQRHALFSTLNFEIVDGGVIVTHHSPSSGFQERFSFFELSENTEREMHREWPWLVAAALMIPLAALFVNDALRLQTWTPAWAATGIACAAVVCGYQYFRRSWDRVIFRRWQDDRSAFFMWYNKPDPEEFASFHDTLIDNIRRARLNPRMTPDQRMEIYTQHLQFLVDEGVVTTDQANELLEQKRIALRSEKPKVVSLVK
jgi:hypothetical protein